jgi:hypothetical protein
MISVIFTGQLALVSSEAFDAENRTLDFIENVLPFDSSKYEISISKQFVESNITTIQYNCTADESVIAPTCVFTGNILTGCIVNIQTGIPICTRTFNTFADAAQDFLEKYQRYNNESLLEMIKILTEIDETQNMTITHGNIKLEVSTNQFDTSFSWTNTIDDAEYTKLRITFRNGYFYAMRDNRGLFTIGKTDVNISAEQAINAAMEYIKDYSYTSVTGSIDNPEYVQIRGFDVNEEKTTAELKTSTKGDDALYPYWNVQLTLAESKGNVWALLVGVWADSGEVFKCNTLAVGGSEGTDTIPKNEDTTPQSLQPTQIVLLLTTIAIIGVTITAIIKKKRKNQSHSNPSFGSQRITIKTTKPV